jgi:hypothetical protein
MLRTNAYKVLELLNKDLSRIKNEEATSSSSTTNAAAGPGRVTLERMVSIFVADSETLVLNEHRTLHWPHASLRVSDASEYDDGRSSSSRLTEVIISEGYSLKLYNHRPGVWRAYPTDPAWSVVVFAPILNLTCSICILWGPPSTQGEPGRWRLSNPQGETRNGPLLGGPPHADTPGRQAKKRKVAQKEDSEGTGYEG